MIICINVVLRYAFGIGRIEFEEIQWHIYATGFLLGLAYSYQADAHIRVDVVHERLSPRLQAWVASDKRFRRRTGLRAAR